MRQRGGRMPLTDKQLNDKKQIDAPQGGQFVRWCGKSEMALFDPLVVQDSIVDVYEVAKQPKNAINDNCIEFEINKAAGVYLDLAKTFLLLKMKIVKADGGAYLAATDKVGPVNNVLHSLFSQVDVYINNTLVSSNDNLYPYRAYIENLLSYNREAKAEQLVHEGYYEDETGPGEDGKNGNGMDVTDPTLVTKNSVPAVGSAAAEARVQGNKGLTERRKPLVGRSHTYYGRLHCDFFQQSKLLLDDCDVRVKLTRNKSSFILMGAAATASAYTVVIEHAELRVPHVAINPQLALETEEHLAQRPAQYNLKRIDMKTFTIPTQTNTFNQEIYTGPLPTRLILGFVNNTALNGSYTENPYNFKHINLTTLQLIVNGRIHNGRMYNRLDFENNEYGLSQLSLVEGLNKAFHNTGVGIKPDQYAHGYTLFAFDLTPNDQLGHNKIAPSGSARLDITLKEHLTTAATLVCYGEFDTIYTIDKHRNCMRIHG